MSAPSPPPVLEKQAPRTAPPDEGLRRELGRWSLTAIAFGGMVGSGWLFSAYYAAQAAGPAALLSWPVAGAAMMLVGLVLVQLGATRPRAGGMVRWPLEANGPLVGTAIGWAVLLSVASALAAEASAIVQYAGHYVPDLYRHGALTARGIGAAVVLLAALALLNWFGVRLFARVTTALTVFKFGVPLITIAVLVAAGFHPGTVEAGGGFAPYGWSAALSAVAGAGIIYTFNGFAAPIELSAEARDPRRDLPRAVITAILLAVVLYTVLQLVFVGTIPIDRLAGGWHGIDFDSPFGQLALALNIGWLATLIYADAVLSPTGAAGIFVASGSRETYAAARNGVLPAFFASVHPASGVPRRTLLANFVLATVFLAPFHGWQEIIGVVGVLSLLTYAACSVAVSTFRATDHEPGNGADCGLGYGADRKLGYGADGGLGHGTDRQFPYGADHAPGHDADREAGNWRMRGMGWIAPAGFVVSTELVHWAGWHQLSTAIPLMLAALVIFAIRYRSDRDRLAIELRSGAWFLGYLLLLFVAAAAGSTGGSGLVTAPWDSVAVGAAALLVHRWGVRSGVRRAQHNRQT
ncbi:APC family permease [Streptomyces sp. NPDC048361]|uniref:APC family permease n=1 Tax=Streptomyces sp. NPDC048361 TaxID=3154720 RepID=UPI00341E6D57